MKKKSVGKEKTKVPARGGERKLLLFSLKRRSLPFSSLEREREQKGEELLLAGA